MAAPYPVDPKPGQPGPGAGWAMPADAPPPYAPPGPQPGYNTQPGYPPQPGYIPQPGYAQPGYGPQPGYAPQPAYPGPYPTQPGVHPDGYPQPVYNASGGGFPIQPGTRPQGGPGGEPKNDPLPGQFGGSFSDKAIRHAFIRKVYLILFTQLLVTLGFVALFTFHNGVKRFVLTHQWVYFLSYAFFIVTYIAMVCCSSVRRKFPANIIMLSIFTLALSYMTGTIASTYSTNIVIMTVGITALICFLITLFATQTKYDFTGCGVYLFVASMILIVFSIICIFTSNKIMETIYSACIALLFSMYLIYDTQMIVGGRKHELSAEEHIYGALQLYLDIIYIFLSLLSLIGSNK